MKIKVGDEFSEVKPSLRDYSKATDVLETVSGSVVVKPVVDRWWWGGVRARFNGLFAFGGGLGLFRWLGWGLGLAFVSCFNHC
jgi:hypothetical protein